MRPAHEQILYLYLLCSRHTCVLYSLVLREKLKRLFPLFSSSTIKASCSGWTDQLRHACSFQVNNNNLLPLCSRQTLSTHSWGLHGEFILQICTWFIVLCFVILYVVKVQADSYIQSLKPSPLPTAVPFGLSSARGPARLAEPFRAER